MRKFNISDIEGLTGIKAHTIRKWEQRYQLLDTRRTETNIRYYDDQDLCYFLNIAYLVNNGFKISKLAQMPRNEVEQQVANLSIHHSTIELQEQMLINATIKLDHLALDKLIRNCIATNGLVNAATQVFFPFLNKIGRLWQVGSINPAHEHLATNLIRQKIISAIGQLPLVTNVAAKKYMLFLPGDETHDIGLLLAYYLLQKAGQHVLYLGQNMPVADLTATANYYQPHGIVTVITLAQGPDASNLIRDIALALSAWPVIVSGSSVLSQSVYLFDNIKLVKNFDEFEALIT